MGGRTKQNEIIPTVIRIKLSNARNIVADKTFRESCWSISIISLCINPIQYGLSSFIILRYNTIMFFNVKRLILNIDFGLYSVHI